jgi:hypothetical protein
MRTHISRIRNAIVALGGHPNELIITGSLDGRLTTYRLASGVVIDAEKFRRLAAAGAEAIRCGEDHRGAELLDTALKLWDNDLAGCQWGGLREDDRRPLAEAAGRPFAGGRRTELLRVRKDAMLDKLTAYIGLGRNRQAAAELDQVAQEYPGEGAALRLLAIALYRCERMTEAADVCRRAIDSIRAIGHDDSPFQELQYAILSRKLPLRGSLVG